MTYLLDCRWLGHGGAGRVTEFLLRAWKASPPGGSWTLWGPESTETYLWPGARLAVAPVGPPTTLLTRPPSHHAALFLHQIRPRTSSPSVTLIHDTIPVRYGGRATVRHAKHRILRYVAGHSLHILTPSAFSKASIVEDLGVEPDRITVAPLPADPEWSDRVVSMRRSMAQAPIALCVSRHARHKNLEALVASFRQTEFLRQGGRLVVVGITEREAIVLERTIPRDSARTGIELRSVCPQDELDELYATAALLVCPSLEEGFGLPVHEALSVGLPVATSSAGALAEVTPYASGVFDPTSTRSMAEAIDRAATSAPPPPPPQPSIAEFGAQVARVLSETLGVPGP